MKSDSTKPTCRERLMYLNIIAEIRAEHARELAEKDEVIAYYRRAAELATRSKHRAIDRRDEQRKDIIAWGICITCIAFAVWLGGTTVHEIILWASGR